MKTIIPKIKTMFLASTLITSTITTGFAQQVIGDNCQTPKILPTPAQTCSQNNEIISNPEKWFRVKVESRAIEIKITQPQTNAADITAVRLIDGYCQVPLPITETNTIATDGSLTLRAENLVPGQECFIKVERGNTNGNFEMCIKEVPQPIIPEPTASESLVGIAPDLGQGYLVLNNMGLPVTNWQLIIVKHNFTLDTALNNEATASRRVAVVERTFLPTGVNYHFIKEEYSRFAYEENFMVNITGLNSNGEAIITESNVQLNPNNGGLDAFLECGGCTSFVPNCAINCLSNNFAYSIQQYKRIGINLSHFRVENALPIINQATLAQTQNPFYIYKTLAAHLNDCGSSTIPCASDGIRVIGTFTSSPIPNQPQFFGPGGGLLVGPVVGVIKNRGLWSAKEIEALGTNGSGISIGDEFCFSTSWDIQQAVSLMNGNGNFSMPNGPDLPFLFHNAQTDFSFKSGLDIGTNDCLGINPNLTDTTFSSSGLISAFLDELTTCLCDNDIITFGCEDNGVGNGNNPKPWMDVLEELIITDLNNPTATPITINVSDMFKNNNGNGVGGNGVFNGLDITLEESLYTFGMLLKNGNYVAKVAKVTGSLRELITQNDLTDIVVFPAPIVGNKYDVRIKSQATVAINYELRDFTGNLILTRSYNVHKGHEKEFKVNHSNIPKGILFHRFVFADGSSRTIQTIKN